MPPPSSPRTPVAPCSPPPAPSSQPRSRLFAFLTSALRPLPSIPPRPQHSSRLPSPVPRLLLLLLLLSSFILQPSSFSTPPPWWTTRGVLDPNATPDDYAPANAGQLKNMAKALYDEIEFRVPGGPSPALYSHMEALVPGPDDYVVINLGQLKHVMKPFYDFLAPFGGPAVPWPAPGPATDDYAPANLGQLKNVFAQLDPASLLAAPAMADDSDGDGLTNAEEIVVGTDPYTPNTVIHGAGTIVTKGIGVYRAKNGVTGFLGQNRYLKEEYTDNLNFDSTDGAGTRTVWTRTETTIKVVNTEGGVVSSSQHLHQEGYTVVAGVTYPHTVFDSQTTSGTPVLLSRTVGGLTDNIQSDALRTSTTLNGPFSGGSTATYSELFDDARLNKLILGDLKTHPFPAPAASPASPDWGQHHWYWPPAPYRYYWNDLPCAAGNPLQFYPYSAIRFFYPPQGSGLVNSVARNKLQFALKVDNPQPGVVYVKRGVMVWRPQNGLMGNGTVVNTVNLMVKGGAGGPVVYSPAWIMEARGGYGRLDVVDSGAYLNLAGVSESEENNYGAKVIGAGTSVGISFGVGASGAAEAFRVRFHLRQGDPAHAYVRRPAPSTVQVPWDVPFEIYHSSDPNWEFGADAPGVYVIEQVTSVLIGGQDIVVDREYVTVTVVDFTKLQISSADSPPRAIEDTTSPDEPRTAANTLYLCEDPTGFTTLNIQGWWEPESTGNAECKWVIQEINDSSGTPSGRWESGYGTFSANPAVSIFNGNTPGTAREFKVTGWYDCNADNVLDPGEPSRQVFVTVLKVELDGLRVYDPKLENAGNAEIKYKIDGPASGFTPRLELTVMDGASEVASIVQKTSASPAIGTEITKNWDGKWGSKKDGTDTVHKGKLADPKKNKIELKVYESATATAAICTKEYDLYVVRLGALEMGFLDDQEVTYHKKTKDDTDNYQFTDNSGFANDVVWKMEHIDFLKPAGPVCRTEARKEQTSTGESYADTDNATGRTGTEAYFDEDGDGGYTAGLRQANFPPQTPTANKDVSGGIENARYNRPAVYVRNRPVKIWFKFGAQAMSDLTLADCDVGYPVAAHPIWVAGKFGGADMGRDATASMPSKATDADAIRNIDPAGGPYKLKSAAILPNTVGYNIETIEFTFKYNKKGESYEDTNGNGTYDAGETITRDNGNGTYDEELVDVPGKQTTTHLVYRLANSPHYASMDFSARPAPFNEKLEQLFLKIVDFTCAWGQAAGAGTESEVFESYWNNAKFWTPFVPDGALPALKPDHSNGFKGVGDPTEEARLDAWINSPMCYTYRHDLGAGQTVNGWLDDNYARCGGWSPVLRTFMATHGLASDEQVMPAMKWRFVSNTGIVSFEDYVAAENHKNTGKRPGGAAAQPGDIWYKPLGIWVSAHGQANPYFDNSRYLHSFWITSATKTDHVFAIHGGRYYDGSYEHAGGANYATINAMADVGISHYYYHEMWTCDPAGVFQDTTAMMPLERIWWPIDPFFGWSPFWHLLKVKQDPAADEMQEP